MTRSKGFTLIELMVVLAILAIIAFIAVPNFSTFIRDNRIESQAEEFNALLQYARSESVIRKIDTLVQIDAGAGDITVLSGGNNGTVIRTSTLDLNGIDFSTSANQIGYRFNGTATAADFRALFCNGDTPSTGRLLAVSASGSTTLYHKGQNTSGVALTSCSL